MANVPTREAHSEVLTFLPTDPCNNGGLCKDEVNDFLCTCLLGFRGTTCEEDINECESSPCKNGANCTDCVNSYTCTCPAGFSGINCENNTPDCTERYTLTQEETRWVSNVAQLWSTGSFSATL